MKLLERVMQTVMILAVSVLFCSMANPAEAMAAKQEDTRRGSIEVRLNDLGTDREGVGFRIYRMSEIDADEDISKIDFTSSAEVRELALKLKKKVEKSDFPYVEKKTDRDGRVKFTNLVPDIYLIVQSKKADYGTVDPFLVRVPTLEDEKEVFDVVTNPKGEALKPDNPPDTPTEEDPPKKTPKNPPSPQTDGGTAASVKTGDESRPELYAALALIALAAMALSIAERRRRGKGE